MVKTSPAWILDMSNDCSVFLPSNLLLNSVTGPKCYDHMNSNGWNLSCEWVSFPSFILRDTLDFSSMSLAALKGRGNIGFQHWSFPSKAANSPAFARLTMRQFQNKESTRTHVANNMIVYDQMHVSEFHIHHPIMNLQTKMNKNIMYSKYHWIVICSIMIMHILLFILKVPSYQ